MELYHTNTTTSHRTNKTPTFPNWNDILNPSKDDSKLTEYHIPLPHLTSHFFRQSTFFPNDENLQIQQNSLNPANSAI